MGPLDANNFCGKCAGFKESMSVVEDLSEGLTEHLTEQVSEHLTEQLAEDSTEYLAKDLTEHLTRNSSRTVNDSSAKSSVEDFIENPIHANNPIAASNPIINSIGMEFILVPAGEFEMGSPSNEKRRKLWESPVHRVFIKKPFYLGRYPVTQEQWSGIMGSNPSYFRGEKHPAETVSWEDAQIFIQKLNAVENTGEKRSVYRLPTEAEWEYAARARSAGSYFFGDEESKLKEYAWFLENSGFETHPAGLKKPNPWGFYDLYGNVGEWVQDEYHISYKGAPSDGRAWENLFPSVSVPVRIRRGGGWNGNAGCCRSAERLFAAQDMKLNSLGFRVVKEI